MNPPECVWGTLNLLITKMARGMGSPRQAFNRRRRTREGPEPACVRAPLIGGWHTQGRKDEFTSCRGTVQSAWQKPPVRRKGGRAGLPARVSGRHAVRGRQSSPTLEVRLGEQARLVKTVKIQVRWAAAQPGQDRRLPSVVIEDGSGVAIDWVTGRSYSSARRRLNVQSGQRKGGKCAAAPA